MTSEKKDPPVKPSAAVAKRQPAPLKVASARGDAVPGSALAVRTPEGIAPRTAGATHSIQTVFQPWLTITVDDIEYAQLLQEKLVYSGSPVAPAADGNDLLFADKIVHGTATPAALKAAYVPKWQPSTAYAAGTPVLNPSGQIVTANANFTSGATYSASNWTIVSGGSATASAALTFAGLPTAVVPVASGAFASGSGITNYGSDTLRSWKMPVRILADCTSLVLEFANYYGSDADGPQPYTAKVGFELPTGTILAVTAFGQDSFTVNPGSVIRTDPLGKVFKAGDECYVHVTLTVPVAVTGYVWNLNNITRDAYGGYTTTDTSRSGGTYGGTGNQTLGPYRILGVPTSSKPARAVALVGESIQEGAADLSNRVGGFEYGLQRQSVPYVKASKGGESVQGFTGSANQYRLGMLTGCTDAIDNYGTNETAGGQSLATIQAGRLLLAQQLQGVGVQRIWVTTIATQADSTDNQCTVAGQTPRTNFLPGGVRSQLNDWIRDGAPLASASNLTPVATGTAGALRMGTAGHPWVGYLDVASVIEPTVNSGVYKTAGRVVTDGVATASSTTFTSATANFTTADNGLAIWITGAGSAGAMLQTTMTYVNATTATLANAASTTVSAAATYLNPQFYTVDSIHPNAPLHTLIAALLPDFTSATPVPPSPTVVVCESFARANNTPLVAADVTKQAWVTQAGAWVTVGTSPLGGYGAKLSTSSGNASAVIDSGVADCAINLVVQNAAAQGGPCWRGTDGNNYFHLDAGLGLVFRRQSNASTQVATLSRFGSGDYRVVTSGSSHKIYKDRVLVASFTDTFNQTATKHGMWINNTAAPLFKFFTVTTGG